jgi:hypothetical protein
MTMVGRRGFVKILTGLASAFALLRDSAFAHLREQEGVRELTERKVEPQADPTAQPRSRSQRVVESVHQGLVVVGGGLSGICAAICAARSGVKTVLVHDRPVLGWHSSSEVRLSPEFNNFFCPWARETGLMDVFYAEDRFRNHEPMIEGVTNLIWDLVLYEAVTQEKNITLFLNTSVRDVVMRSGSEIEAVEAVQLGTEKDVRLSADLFIDATGMGTLGYLAGADYYWGREGRAALNEPLQPEEPDEETMGNTMYFRARDVHRPIGFQPPAWAARYESEKALGPMRFHNWIEAGYYWLEVGYPYHVIHDNEEIRREQLRQVLGVWDHIKNRGEHHAEDYALEWVSQVPYRRDARRLRGDYILTQHDVQGAPLFEDRVAYGAWPIDIHTIGGMLKAPEPTLNLDLLSEGVNPYSIPYRCLYSRNIENLLVCGRNISCTWVAFASTRILPTGAMTGEAAGAAAGLCRKYGVKPREITRSHIRELQQVLLKQDHYIPHVANEDPNDLARTARVTASSEATLVFPEGTAGTGSEELSVPLAQLFPVSEPRVDRVELWLESGQHSPVRVKLGLRPASTVWDFSAAEDVARAETELAPQHRGWVPFELNAAVELGRLYYAYVEPVRGVRWRIYTESHDIYSAFILNRGKGWWETLKDLVPHPTLVPVGTTAAKRMDLLRAKHFGGRRWNPLFPFGRVFPRAFVFRVSPSSRPYGPANVVNGVARPEAWPNIWISDPQQAFPQWLELALPAPARFNTVYLTFDTNLNTFPEFPRSVAPECVKDYTLDCRSGAGWRTLAEIQGNYHRRRIHRFDPVESDRLRLTVNTTNGAPSARVYEVRIYNE